MDLLAFNISIFCITLTLICFVVFGFIFVIRGFMKDKKGYLDGGKITRGFVLLTIGLIFAPLACKGVFKAFAEEAEYGADFLSGGWLLMLFIWPLVILGGLGVLSFYIAFGIHCVRVGNANTKNGTRVDVDTSAFGYILLTFGTLIILSIIAYIFSLIIGMTLQ